jgi:peptidyl-prolyl cis-trans isomerase C
VSFSMDLKKSICSTFAIAFMTCSAFAAEEAKPVAVINGVKVGQELLSQLMTTTMAQGVKDSPEMRDALKNELVVREVLAQEARKQKIDQEVAVKAQMHLQQSALLSEFLLAKQSEKFNITDEKLRVEYKRQADLLKDAEEYQISHIVTTSEVDAKAVIKAFKDGQPFDKLAKEKSTSPSRQNGGSLGWLLANQITPSIGNVVANMTVGTVTSVPIATPEGWQVVRLDGKRPYKVPSFEESKQQLINAVVTTERSEFVQKLMKAANIQY